MNRNRLHSLRNIVAVLLACVGFASCSQDDLAEKDTSLPAGKYPLELTASIGEAVAAPATRGTVHGQWPYNGNIALHYASRQYPDEGNISWGSTLRHICNIDANGTVNITDMWGHDVTLYWENSKETIYIYTGTNPLDYGTGRSSWTVEADQSDEGKLNQSDYLVAYGAFDFQKNYTYTLEFRHLTSKITVNLKQSDYLKAQDSDAVEVTLATKNEQWYIQGGFNGQPKEITMVGEGNKSRAQEIIPYKNPNQTDAGIYATYEAILIPQQITGTGKTIQIKVGDATYNYTIECPNGKFSGGEEWIYNITVKENKLDVAIDYNASIDWGADGETGSGEVELP